MRFNASASLPSLQQSEMRMYLLPLLPKMNPGVMNTRASCNTRSVSSSTSAQLSGIFPQRTRINQDENGVRSMKIENIELGRNKEAKETQNIKNNIDTHHNEE